MSDIFNGLSEEEIAAYSAIPSEEPHIVVGPNRVVTVPESLKRIGVQYDHNIETVTFDCPRYWDGHDMSTMVVYINYLTPNGETGSFVAQNVTVDENDISIMHFDWTISKHVTNSNGYVKFLVCVKDTNSDGIEIKHWNSELNSDLYISEGLELGNEPIQEDYPDVITQILLRLNDVEEAISDTPGDLPDDKTSAFKIIGFTEGCDYIATADDGYTAFVTAVNEAIDGDTILVMQGTYKGSTRLNIDKDISFIAVGDVTIEFQVRTPGGGEWTYDENGLSWTIIEESKHSKWSGFTFNGAFMVGNNADPDGGHYNGFTTCIDCVFNGGASVVGDFLRCTFTNYLNVGMYFTCDVSSFTECTISGDFDASGGTDIFKYCDFHYDSSGNFTMSTYNNNLKGCKIYAPSHSVYINDNHGGTLYLHDTTIFATSITSSGGRIEGGMLVSGTAL